VSAQANGASFREASTPRSLGDGTFTADLRAEWSIGNHPHGGFLLALIARTVTELLIEQGDPAVEPLAVSAEFLRPPAIGPVLLRTDVRKVGRRVTVVAVRLEQRGRSCVEARVTAGRLPTRKAGWNDVPVMAAVPPQDAVSLGAHTAEGRFGLAKGCDVRMDRTTAGFLSGRTNDPPRMRLWVRARDEEPDPCFALLAGDVNPPVVFNLGRTGWAPTVQLSALLRTRPAPGWLRVQVDCRSIHEGWFDSDATVIDGQGRLVCQARQLALVPRG
jgi:acyl-coenzyme A thioesterase PaaI-like protein